MFNRYRELKKMILLYISQIQNLIISYFTENTSRKLFIITKYYALNTVRKINVMITTQNVVNT